MLKSKRVFLLTALLVLGLVSLGIFGCGPGDTDDEVGFDGQIVGIDPGAGLMSASEEAIEAYDLNVTLVEGSDATMTAALKDAISREEWIIVTGWTPHWKFAAWDLKYLEDPLGVFGDAEHIATVARQGLADDAPEAYHVLKNFYWTAAEIGEVMQMNMEGGSPEGNARAWVDANPDLVQEWLPDVDSAEGSIELLYVEWECATASTYVVKAVLEDLGYEVTVTPVAASLMWSALATGDADAMTTAWLPGTHGHYLEEVEDEVDVVATNFEGAKIGWVVPAYVTIDSIEEINDHVIY